MESREDKLAKLQLIYPTIIEPFQNGRYILLSSSVTNENPDDYNILYALYDLENNEYITSEIYRYYTEGESYPKHVYNDTAKNILEFILIEQDRIAKFKEQAGHIQIKSYKFCGKYLMLDYIRFASTPSTPSDVSNVNERVILYDTEEEKTLITYCNYKNYLSIDLGGNNEFKIYRHDPWGKSKDDKHEIWCTVLKITDDQGIVIEPPFRDDEYTHEAITRFTKSQD